MTNETPPQKDLRTPRGTHDRLPSDEAIDRFIYQTIESRAHGFGYGRIETPIFETPNVFVRSLGETSDIVSKEMFEVKRATAHDTEEGESYILRPENTAAVVRAYLEHGMHTWPQPVRLWYYGPMFRADRPQKGRYRQFWQGGFELFGDAYPTTDAMIIYLFWQIMGDLGIQENLVVDVNSMGCTTCRPKYRKALVTYYKPLAQQLCTSCQTRLDKNPLRLLDCKEEQCAPFKANAPHMVDSLCKACRDHFRIVLESLDELGVVYDLNSTLIRGLDYYTRTTFEIRDAEDIRRQNALGGGGRYDGLVETFGGKATPAVGLSIGIERIKERIIEKEVTVPSLPTAKIFVIQLGTRAKRTCFSLISQLGQAGFSAMCQPGSDSLRTQLKLADKAGVRFALIVGEREARDKSVILKDMLEGTQETIPNDKLMEVLSERLKA